MPDYRKPEKVTRALAKFEQRKLRMERLKRLLDLRAKGTTLEEIARMLGISKQHAHRVTGSPSEDDRVRRLLAISEKELLPR